MSVAVVCFFRLVAAGYLEAGWFCLPRVVFPLSLSLRAAHLLQSRKPITPIRQRAVLVSERLTFRLHQL